MEFNNITLQDKDLFNQYLSGRQQRLLTYNFTNFYLWRNWDPYRWTLLDNALCIKSDLQGDDMLCPISPDNNAVLAATEQLLFHYRRQQLPLTLIEVDEDMRELLTQTWPERFTCIDQPDGDNYIYTQTDLATLSGKHFNAKRNFVHRFLREYPEHRLETLTPEHVPACMELLEKWYAHHDEASYEIHHEYNGVKDGLEHLTELDWTGAVLQVGPHTVAFELGERLNDDTMGIHIEKADIDFTGSFQAINNLFVRDFASGFSYINRAEDMGDEGLRRAKQSYHPCYMERKYTLRSN